MTSVLRCSHLNRALCVLPTPVSVSTGVGVARRIATALNPRASRTAN